MEGERAKELKLLFKLGETHLKERLNLYGQFEHRSYKVCEKKTNTTLE